MLVYSGGQRYTFYDKANVGRCNGEGRQEHKRKSNGTYFAGSGK